MTRPKNTSPPNGPSVRYVLGCWFLSTETSAWTSRTSLPVFRLLGAFTVITLFAQIASSVRATPFSAALLNGPVPSCLVFGAFSFLHLLASAFHSLFYLRPQTRQSANPWTTHYKTASLVEYPWYALAPNKESKGTP